ncbi:MAG: 1-acyl-sn-glycerol-3-phosphate acyltransferase [Candidatus Binatia bacterium]
MPTRRTNPGVGIPLNQNDPLVRAFLAFAHLLARYHRHRVLHLERLGSLLQQGRRVVLVGNHVLDVLDPLLFTAALIERYGRIPHFIGHENLIFRLPGLGALATRYQMIPSRHMGEAAAALRTDGLLMLYPGSGSEAARRSYRDEPYRLKWEKRLGFLRLALRYEAEILFVAAVGVDEMYYQSSLQIPPWLLRLFSAERYQGSRMQFGVLGPHVIPTLLPFPVRITHVVSKPLDLGERTAARRSRAQLATLHRRVVEHCQGLLAAAVAQRERDAPLVDRAVRAGERFLQRLGA